MIEQDSTFKQVIKNHMVLAIKCKFQIVCQRMANHYSRSFAAKIVIKKTIGRLYREPQDCDLDCDIVTLAEREPMPPMVVMVLYESVSLMAIKSLVRIYVA